MKEMRKTVKETYGEEACVAAFGFCSTYIDAIGYDAQRELLEVRMARSGRIRRYLDVPEEIWYGFRESACPDLYYRRCICGRFREQTGQAALYGIYGKRKKPLDKKGKRD